MKWLELKINCQYRDKELASDLVSDIFYDLGATGVVIEDPELITDMNNADRTKRTNHQSKIVGIIGYLPVTKKTDRQIKSLKEKLEALRINLGVNYHISYNKVDEEDWAESWKTYFFPQRITKRIVVKPTWREYIPHPGEIICELNPGMAFGTGSHPTTAMCIRLIEKYLEKGDAFLDIGTGSGILLIVAAKLGAGKLIGVDKDEIAITIAKQNLIINNIDTKRCKIVHSDLVDSIKGKYDIVCANILSEVILKLLGDIPGVLKKNSLFICSGISLQNHRIIRNSLEDYGFDITESLIEDDWVAIAARMGGDKPG